MVSLTEIEKTKINKKILKLIQDKKIDNKMRQVINYRFGLEDNQPLSYSQISKVLDIKKNEVKGVVDEAEKVVFNLLKNKI